jgi:hypothetical protein
MPSKPTIEQLTELLWHLDVADDRSIRWLHDRFGGPNQWEDDLESSSKVEGLIKFFENEPSLLAEWDGGDDG